ncbi:MAG: hypothetical protein QXO72_05130 [Sulfolobales archaeon]
MARKPKRLLVTGVQPPAERSKAVIDRFVSVARVNLPAWSTKYRDGISGYLGDAAKQSEAASKLASWYDIFLTVVYPKVKEVYATAVSRYLEVRRAAAPRPPA